MLALIDGDIVLHRCGYASDGDSKEIALIRTDVMLREILNDTKANEFEVWLSDNRDNNFRYQLDPEYKANRKQPRPVHYDSIKEFMFDEWKANLALGQEADDSLGIRQEQCIKSFDGFNPTDSIICSIDKDLLQIRGSHYNFVRKEFQTVEFIDGIRQFYKQLLIGDVSDNIKGIDKIGPVKAGKLLDGLTSELAMFECVHGLYSDDIRLLRNGKLLWIRRLEEELWTFPKEAHIEQEEEVLLSSIQIQPKENVQSSEPTGQEKSGFQSPGYLTGDSMKSTVLAWT